MSNVEYPNLVPLIHQMAKRYAWCGAEYDDLVAEGYIGLQIAKERFDPDTGNKFITFAWWWIRGKVQQAADRHIPPLLRRLPHAPRWARPVRPSNYCQERRGPDHFR